MISVFCSIAQAQWHLGFKDQRIPFTRSLILLEPQTQASLSESASLDTETFKIIHASLFKNLARILIKLKSSFQAYKQQVAVTGLKMFREVSTRLSPKIGKRIRSRPLSISLTLQAMEETSAQVQAVTITPRVPQMVTRSKTKCVSSQPGRSTSHVSR